MVPFVLLGFAVPLQLIASVFAFLGRDALVGTGFGIFTGGWLAYSLASLNCRLFAGGAVYRRRAGGGDSVLRGLG